MSRPFYKYPPVPSSGAGTFSDEIVGLQLVTGGGLTLANFQFTTSLSEKINTNFNIGAFSDPISLDTLNIETIAESKAIISKEFRVYPNFDLSEISSFVLYGPLTKRLSTSVTKIINYFPGALEISYINNLAISGYTAFDAVYDSVDDSTTFKVDIEKISNPFSVDFTTNSAINIAALEFEVSYLRNLAKEYSKYSLYINDLEFPLLYLEPTPSLFTGFLELTVKGNPFSGQVTSLEYLVIRPNDFYADKAFIEPFDEIQQYLLNRLIIPKYTANFQIPKQTDDGLFYTDFDSVTWPLLGVWNLDIQTASFDYYISRLSDIADSFDSFKTNLVSRFLTTQSFKDFDTSDQRVQKLLTIYGRSFDEVKKFIDALAHITSVNYVVKNDIPSQLLKNLAQTLGWNINISPITNDDFLSSIFNTSSKIEYPGFSRANTPTELNYQFYRNLIMNSAYLFKSKGTRRSIEFMLRLVGAPEALVEFNEHIYIAGERINMSSFSQQFSQISGSTYIQQIPTYDSGSTFSILGVKYSAFTTTNVVNNVIVFRENYPVDDEGFPKAPTESNNYFFQQGAGWYELTKDHQSLLIINTSGSTFTGTSFNLKTEFQPFTYGQKYLKRFRNFPYMTLGYNISKITDNKKSWVNTDTDVRLGTKGSNYDAYYRISNEKFVLNVKNTDIFLKPSQGLEYDVWYMSKNVNYPIPSTGLTSPYPEPGGIDWTVINPMPSKKSFFEFAQSFWFNMINVRNRQFINDGKTGGYPTLQSLWWKYIESDVKVNIPNDNYTYQTMIDYINGLGTYWIRLVEQMVPATTIWMGGTKFDNSIFHRQKFVYRLQRGCRILPLPCDPDVINTFLFPSTCVNENIEPYIFPWDNENNAVSSFKDVLYTVVTNYLDEQSINLSGCVENTIISTWFMDIRYDNVPILQKEIYTGYGFNDVPSNNLWLTTLQTYLPDILTSYGLGVIFNIDIDKPTIFIYNLGCDPNFLNKEFELNVGIQFSIRCD